MLNDKRTHANGWPCKHVRITGGDWVPYGNSGAHLPESEECDNPLMDEYLDRGELTELECCGSCPLYEPDPDFTFDDGDGTPEHDPYCMKCQGDCMGDCDDKEGYDEF